MIEKIGKYLIREEIGRGGMGIIYKALDPDINRDVAIKIIRNDLISDGPSKDKTLRQFMVEAQAAGRLCHPNIATIFEVGRQDDTTFIAMQFIPGRSLRKRIESGKLYGPEEAAALIVPLCRALDYAHRAGIVHRDIKPDNILLDGDGVPHLVDFGIATVESINITRTRSSTSATPAYMSPEQILEGPVDFRTDIFSLGIILFEIMTGKRPFTGDNLPSLLNRIVTEEPASLATLVPDAPAELEAIILKALAKKPEDRFASAGDMAAALEGALHPEARTSLLQNFQRTQPLTHTKTRGVGRRPGAGLFRGRGRAFLFPALAACALLLGFLIWKQFFAPAPDFDAVLSIRAFDVKAKDVPAGLIEYLLDRTLNAATQVPVFPPSDRAFLERQADANNARARRPMMEISGSVSPTLTGFEIGLSFSHKGAKKSRTFACKGMLDLISSKINDILAFLAAQSAGDIGRIEGGRTFAQIATGNWDALSHFLKGQDEWTKLASEAAYREFRTALENDPGFGLAHLRQAEVQLFRGDRADARAECDAALADKARLIGYDELRRQALLARLEDRPGDERTFLMQLIEAFPLKKDYLYDFAESYFHSGDGEAAIPYYLRALNLDPSYALAHNHIAFCYAWTGDHAKAEEHFLKYAGLDNTANSFDSLATGYMFSGRYDKAFEALDKARALDPKLDYLYGNLATNLWLTGGLAKAEEALDKELGVATRDTTRIGVQVNRALIAWLRGDAAKAEAALAPARDYYGTPAFAARLDEGPILPFWLTGVLAAEGKDPARLKAMIALLEKRVADHGVNATNYFPVLKFLIHLKVLEGRLRNDPARVMEAVQDGERIRAKMGYWSSPFNLAFFLDQYAGAVRDTDKASNKPRELLLQVVAYNPAYAPARVKMAGILLAENKREEAAAEAAKARELLARADKDLVLARELSRVEGRLGGK